MKFHEGGGGMMGYHHHNLMDMYPGPAINTMDWKNTSQVRHFFHLLGGGSNLSVSSVSLYYRTLLGES